MRIPDNVLAQINKLQRVAAIVGVVAIVATIIGLLVTGDRERFFRSYLFSYMFWLGLSGGSLGLLMLHHVVGGGWGFIIRRFLETAAKTLPLMLLLWIPIVIGANDLYPWMRPEGNELLEWQSGYMNLPLFIGRTIIFFAIWIGYTLYLNRLSLRQDADDSHEVYNLLTTRSAFGLLVFTITMTFAVIDLTMSTNHGWYSSIYGLVFMVGQALATLAFMLVLLAYLTNGKHPVNRVPPLFFRDLGNLMLAFTLVWAYTSFSQFLIIYAGNLAEFASFYTVRREGIWWYIITAIIGLHFFVPFFTLLVGDHIKRNIVRLAQVAAFMLVMRWIDLYWTIMPAWPEVRDTPFHLFDFTLPFAIGGIWLAVFATLLKKVTSLVPLNDPRLKGNLPHGISTNGAVSHGGAPLQEAAQHG